VGGTSALLVVLSSEHLRLPPSGFALLLLAIGAGALVGPFILNAVTQNPSEMRLVFFPYLVRGAGDILIALLTPIPLALLLLFIYGISTSTGMITYNSFMQANIPDRVRGRTYTLFDLSWSVMEIASLGLAGWLNDNLGVQVVYYLGGSLLIIAGQLGLGLLSKPAAE
jgi:sugar phosphate permease